MATQHETQPKTPRQVQGAHLIREMRCGNGPLIGLADTDIDDIVVSYAPYGKAARVAYFARLQAAAARRVPCEYD